MPSKRLLDVLDFCGWVVISEGLNKGYVRIYGSPDDQAQLGLRDHGVLFHWWERGEVHYATYTDDDVRIIADVLRLRTSP